MEPAVIALLVVSGLLLVLGLISLMLGAGQARPKEKVEDGEDAIEPAEDEGRGAGRRGRAAGGVGRMRLRRPRGMAAAAAAAAAEDEMQEEARPARRREPAREEVEGDEDEEEEEDPAALSKKERKKREKEAKRLAEEAAREAKEGKRGAYLERQQRKEAEREAEEQRKAREAAEEQEQREKEAAAELDKWKTLFSVENEGTVESDTAEESQGLLSEFVDYIKKHKCVVLEDLAAQFGLRAQDAVNRVISLEQMGRISGVMDDRGKFIYISTDEMRAVADYIRQQGRVSIATLAERSNQLIDLEAKETPADAWVDEPGGADATPAAPSPATAPAPAIAAA